MVLCVNVLYVYMWDSNPRPPCLCAGCGDTELQAPGLQEVCTESGRRTRPHPGASDRSYMYGQLPLRFKFVWTCGSGLLTTVLTPIGAVLTPIGMVVDNCSACGEEHEPPRGTKCKRAKMPKRTIKSEVPSSDEDSERGVELHSPPIGEVVAAIGYGKRAELTAGDDVGEEDEEERALKRELALLVRDRRKQALRAQLKEELERARDPEPATAVAVEAVTTVAKAVKKVKKKAVKKEVTTKKGPDVSSDSSSEGESSSSSDDDSSGSESRTRRRRRRRSKFALNRFAPNEKRLKKLTVLELIYAALRWGIKRGEKVGMDYQTLRGYMGHVAYMCMHATTSVYTDRTYRSYDKAVRSKVKEEGLGAFSQGNMEISLLHFNHDNIKPAKEVRPASRFSAPARQFDKKICYAFNYSKSGCTVRKCDYEHKCLVCKSSDHAIDGCRRKRY